MCFAITGASYLIVAYISLHESWKSGNMNWIQNSKWTGHVKARDNHRARSVEIEGESVISQYTDSRDRSTCETAVWGVTDFIREKSYAQIPQESRSEVCSCDFIE